MGRLLIVRGAVGRTVIFLAAQISVATPEKAFTDPLSHVALLSKGQMSGRVSSGQRKVKSYSEPSSGDIGMSVNLKRYPNTIEKSGWPLRRTSRFSSLPYCGSE